MSKKKHSKRLLHPLQTDVGSECVVASISREDYVTCTLR